MLQIISLLLENKPGALMRVTGLLTARDPIQFYAEVPLYESELDDNGASQLSVKVARPSPIPSSAGPGHPQSGFKAGSDGVLRKRIQGKGCKN